MARKPRTQPEPERRNEDEAVRWVEALEKLELEKRDVAHSITDLLVQAADAGFLKKTLKEAVKRRLETPEAKSARVEYESALADLLTRLGEFADTPLGSAAVTLDSGRLSHMTGMTEEDREFLSQREFRPVVINP